MKGLNSTVITYIQKCFGYAIKQHANDPTGMRNSRQLIAPHAFGDHSGCQGPKWCKFNDDPENFKHSDLPGGRNLQGEDLRSAIEDAIRPFLRDDVISKLIHVGSTQGNESLNGVIGSKTPKIRHYGGSESVDYRTAAGVAQFNDGSCYITDVCQELNLVSSSVTANHVDKARKSTRTFKKRRNQLKKTKHQKPSSQERREGVTYQSGVGLTSGQDTVEVTKDTLTLLNETITKEQFKSYVGKLAVGLHGIDIPSDRDRLSEASQSGDVSFFIIDLETTGLERSAEIIQLSCKSLQYQSSFNTYLLPETRNIKEAASKVHGISVQYKDDQKVLQKEGKTLPAVEQQSGLKGFIDYLYGIEQVSGRRVALVAHNGFSFDFPVLFKSLERYGLMETFGEIKLLFVDSLKIIAEEVKKAQGVLSSCSSKSLGVVYEHLFEEKFEAHDAAEDTEALSRILMKIGMDKSKADSHGITLLCMTRRIQRSERIPVMKTTFDRLPITDSMKKKMAEAGLEYQDLRKLKESGGERAVLAILSLPKKFCAINDNKSKPRVTKNRRVLTTVLVHL